MTTRRNIGKLINQAVRKQPINKMFLTDLMLAIEQKDQKGRRKPSKTYKPSSLVCSRQMYFMRIGMETDGRRTEYNAIGMADTGTRRHEAIQDVLLAMKEMNYDWEYLDVEDYLAQKWAEGKCLNIEVKERHGAETRLFDNVLGVSFMCDGIIRQISTQDDYLFEFKNQISFKYNGKQDMDEEHKDQTDTYCMELDLDKVLITYENRDTCELECFLHEADQEAKNKMAGKIIECEEYVKRLIAPPKHTDTKPCRWCNYTIACKKAGN